MRDRPGMIFISGVRSPNRVLKNTLYGRSLIIIDVKLKSNKQEHMHMNLFNL